MEIFDVLINVTTYLKASKFSIFTTFCWFTDVRLILIYDWGDYSSFFFFYCRDVDRFSFSFLPPLQSSIASCCRDWSCNNNNQSKSRSNFFKIWTASVQSGSLTLVHRNSSRSRIIKKKTLRRLVIIFKVILSGNYLKERSKKNGGWM